MNFAAFVLTTMLALPLIAWSAPPVAKAGPTAPAAAWRIADEAWRTGDVALARGLTAELVAKFPDDPALWLRLGEIEQRRGDFAASLLAFDSALAFARDGDGPMLATTRLRRAELLLQEADRELAASGDAPLLADVEDRRDALRSALDFARNTGLLEARKKSVRREGARARGYVVDADQAKGKAQGARP
jgi:predicted Zn-dependent protease